MTPYYLDFNLHTCYIRTFTAIGLILTLIILLA